MGKYQTTGKITVLVENAILRRVFEFFPPGYDVAGVRRDDPGAAERLRETEVLIGSGNLLIDRALVDGMPNLRYLQNHGVGVDKVDLPALFERGIIVSNTLGHNAIPVAEHALMLTLVLCRRFVGPYLNLKQKGEWRGAGEEAWELAGKTMAILGVGHIGRAVARMAQGFDMRVLGWQRRPDQPRPPEDGIEFWPLEPLLRAADVLCIATPLSSQTRGLINAERLAWLKPSAIIVNIGRGPIIDEAALIEAIEAGRLAGAGLDVTTQEPLPADSPLRKVENIVLTPHYAGGSKDARPRGRQYVYANIERYFRGETPERLVTADMI